MRAQYIEAPSPLRIRFDKSIFLGGGITNCIDWQKKVVDALADLEVSIINPRRANFDLADATQSEIQIDWEYKYLRAAAQIIFWFSPETVCPITLFELGATLERYHFAEEMRKKNIQTIFIGVHPEYKRIFDVKFQARKKGFGVIEGLDNLIQSVREYNETEYNNTDGQL